MVEEQQKRLRKTEAHLVEMLKLLGGRNRELGSLKCAKRDNKEVGRARGRGD